MASFEGDVSSDLVPSSAAAQCRSSFHIPYAIHDGDAVFECHCPAHSQILPDRSPWRKVDRLELSIERLHETQAALLTICQFDSGEASRLA
jgi:hypothetical protein